MGMFDKNISEEKKASLEFAEEQREEQWKHPSFALQFFHGELDWELIYPFPKQPQEDKQKGDHYIKKIKEFLIENLDPDEVDKTYTIPEHVVKGLADLGAFAMKMPEEYGGVGLSQVNYNRVIHMISSYCGSTAVLLSAHQSIGVPQPLKLFGTEEQKKKYLPAFARGSISGFALTEPDAGSDPRNMLTSAVPTEDGNHYILNGEKLWCTNGNIADVIVVMAVTPPKIVRGKERKQITAFIVDTNTEGFEIVHRCHFMGLHGIQNGLLRFNNVKVPRENIILSEGEGLKLALTTLNTGRLTLPAASVGIGKWCLSVSRQWSSRRKQWGSRIGDHQSIAAKLAYIASHTYAMDAMTWLASSMADDQRKDIRLEAAMAKYFCTEHSWRIADETLQIRGGQGYETAESLKARGMKDWAVERVLREFPQCELDVFVDEHISFIVENDVRSKGYWKVKRTLFQAFCDRTYLGTKLVFSLSLKSVLKLTRSFYPAPVRTIKTIKRNLYLVRDAALENESESFGILAVSDFCHFFLSLQFFQPSSLDESII